MNRFRWQILLCLVLYWATSPAAQAQRGPFGRDPHIGYVYPAGGQQDTTVEVRIGGQYLNGASRVYISGEGVEAEFVKYHRPLRPNEANKLREKLQQVRKKMQAEVKSWPLRRRRPLSLYQQFLKYAKEQGLSQENLKDLEEYQRIRTDPKRQLNPQIAETVIVRVHIASDAPPGPRDLRVGTAQRLSNPVRFYVGQLPEYRESVPGSGPPAWLASLAARLRARRLRGAAPARRSPYRSTSPQEPPASQTNKVKSLPAVLNGQILPGQVDRFTFSAKRGQKLVVAVKARELIPYLADAVPGWFQATVAIYDSSGKELAFADDYRFNPDPVLYYQVPRNGQYVLEVRDALYRGREDFVYRITVGQVPWLTSLFPLGARQGQPASVELQGWNLPTKRLTVDTAGQARRVQTVSVTSGGCQSNCLPFAVGTLPECLEQEPNDGGVGSGSPAAALAGQPVQLPVVVNGRIGRPGDRDVFRFRGRAGQKVVAEVYARRLNSPVDSLLELTDAAGHVLAVNDDHEDKGAGLSTHHADSWLMAELPADGTYFVVLNDTQHQGGPEYAYRLRISPPQPDFELRVVPSSINARPGLAVPVTVYALRKDGFDGDITIELTGERHGCGLSGGWVPASQDRVRLTLIMPPDTRQGPLRLHLEGRAVVGGREIRHPAVPADDMMQAFIYHHLVPAQELLVTVAGRGRAGPPLRFVGDMPVRLPAGGTAQVRLLAPRANLLARLSFELSDPPEGIAIEDVRFGELGLAVQLRADADKVSPGQKGNLIVQTFANRGGRRAGGSARRARQRIPLATLPAIPFEVVAP